MNIIAVALRRKDRNMMMKRNAKMTMNLLVKRKLRMVNLKIPSCLKSLLQNFKRKERKKIGINSEVTSSK